MGFLRRAGTASTAPSISVITVALNAERTIRATIESVLAQSTPPTEYVIIDGGSSDRTVEIAREYGDAVTTLATGPDGGIFEGMNRGLAACRANVVGFLNANDCYAHAEVLERIRTVMADPDVDGCYGNLDFVDASGRTTRRWRSSDYQPSLLQTGWVPPHPTFYCRREVLARFGGFRDHYRIAGDYELFLRLLAIHRIRVRFIPEVLVKMESGGLSNGRLPDIISGNQEVVQAWRENGLSPPRLIGLRKPLAKIMQLRFGRA